MWFSVVTLINYNLRTWSSKIVHPPRKEFSVKQISLAQSSLEIAPNTMRKRLFLQEINRVVTWHSSVALIELLVPPSELGWQGGC